MAKLYLEPQELNEHDEYAVAVRKDGETVRHVPHSFSHISCTRLLIRPLAFISYIYALPLVFICDQAFI